MRRYTPPTYTLNRHRRRHQSETQPPGTCSKILGNCDSMLKCLFCRWIEQVKPFSSLRTHSPPFLTNSALRCPNCKLGPQPGQHPDQPGESYNRGNQATCSLCRLCALLIEALPPSLLLPLAHGNRLLLTMLGGEPPEEREGPECALS